MAFFQEKIFKFAVAILKLGGNGEIRTHGAFRHDSFQDCCNKPDSATFPLLVRKERLELSILSAMASKTIVYTIPPLAHIITYHIETHCCGRRIPSDVVSRNQTFSIYTVLSTMYFYMASHSGFEPL